jgi:hypothetical protein
MLRTACLAWLVAVLFMRIWLRLTMADYSSVVAAPCPDVGKTEKMA